MWSLWDRLQRLQDACEEEVHALPDDVAADAAGLPFRLGFRVFRGLGFKGLGFLGLGV